MKNNTPLISVIVITYNSSKYVVDTLESIKEQTYKHIELVITDDCSSDDTIELCKNWIELNGNRFVRVILVTSEENTGVPANCNRGYKKANGEWLKAIAGDDILLFDSISRFVNEYDGKEGIVAGRFESFYVNKECVKCYNGIIEPNSILINRMKTTAPKQLHYMLRENFIAAPTVFISKKIWEEVGEFDEHYKMLEDYPYWIRCLTLGHSIYYMDLLIAYYRCNSDSLTSSAGYFYNLKYFECLSMFKREVIYPRISKFDIIYWQNEINANVTFYILCKILHNRKSQISLVVSHVLSNFSIAYQLLRFKKNVFYSE